MNIQNYSYLLRESIAEGDKNTDEGMIEYILDVIQQSPKHKLIKKVT